MTYRTGTYECAVCHETFDYDQSVSEEELAAETLEVFGVAHSPDDAVVCDDCYERIRP
jgi:NAD-dependent dihydropyrimidine dehydrogenase PreA subunit